MKTDRELCAEVLNGDGDALDKLTARYARQISRIAEERFRRADMAEDLMAAVHGVLSAPGHAVLAEWFELPADSLSTLIEKLGTETPLDGDE